MKISITGPRRTPPNRSPPASAPRRGTDLCASLTYPAILSASPIGIETRVEPSLERHSSVGGGVSRIGCDTLKSYVSEGSARGLYTHCAFPHSRLPAAPVCRQESHAKLVQMSFLDSLENNLKALEGREQGGLDDQKRRDTDRERAAASAPWAERLKTSPYTQALLQQATRAGFQIRIKVNFLWLGTALRLEARNVRLELRPTADGIEVLTVKDGAEIKREKIDLAGTPDQILTPWMQTVEAQKKADDAAAAEAAAREPED